MCVCVQLFETMTEVMQGPCPGNQLLLSQSRMLEAVNGIWNAIVTAQHHRYRFPAARLPSPAPVQFKRGKHRIRGHVRLCLCTYEHVCG